MTRRLILAGTLLLVAALAGSIGFRGCSTKMVDLNSIIPLAEEAVEPDPEEQEEKLDRLAVYTDPSQKKVDPEPQREENESGAAVTPPAPDIEPSSAVVVIGDRSVQVKIEGEAVAFGRYIAVNRDKIYFQISPGTGVRRTTLQNKYYLPCSIYALPAGYREAALLLRRPAIYLEFNNEVSMALETAVAQNPGTERLEGTLTQHSGRVVFEVAPREPMDTGDYKGEER